MRNIKYQDGTPSREFEEDEEEWMLKHETSDLQAEYTENISILSIRDKITHLSTLIESALFLLNHDVIIKRQEYAESLLLDFATPLIKKIDEELKQLWNQSK